MLAGLAQRLRHLQRLLRGEQPVGAQSYYQATRVRVDPLERRRRPRLVFGQIEDIHGLGNVQVGVGVKSVDKLRALVVQVAFDLKRRGETARRQGAVALSPAELALHVLRGQIGDMPDHTRLGQPVRRRLMRGVIIAAQPVGVGHDRMAADNIERQGLGGKAHGRSNAHAFPHDLRVTHAPGQGLHAAERAADHRRQPLDPQLPEQQILRLHNVAGRNFRKSRTVGPAGARIRRTRPGRAHAPAQDIRANHVKPVGVDALARPDHGIPPARLAVGGVMVTGDMRVAGERMADIHRVAAIRGQGSVSLIGHLQFRQDSPAFQNQAGGRQSDFYRLRLNHPHAAGGGIFTVVVHDCWRLRMIHRTKR